MKKKSTYLFLFLSFFLISGISHSLCAQNKILFEATLLDAATNKPIPFANIYNFSQHKGTTSNLEGYFKIIAQPSDSLSISFIGYTNLRFKLADYSKKGVILLEPSVHQLNEVIVLADNTWLYPLLKKAKKTGTYKPLTSKTYFELETYVNSNQVELVEAYYNGEFTGYDVNNLAFKNGRIAHTKDNKFVSFETSKVLLTHQQFSTNYYFPNGPLELSYKKLKAQFDLQLEGKYEGENQHPILIIQYTPKSINGFSGKIWLDSLTHEILKITAAAENAKPHPFLPITPLDTLSKVKLHLEKTFQKRNGNRYVDHINFETRFHYKRENGDTLNVKSQAILYAYDYEQPFALPYFNFTKNARYIDYVNTTIAPHNEVFWEVNEPFKINKADNSIEKFYESHEPFYGSFFETKDSTQHFFENPYLSWNKKRIVLREEIPQKIYDNTLSPKVISSAVKNVPTDAYHLEVQLYLDVNKRNDSLFTYTQTIIDPFKTYYELPMDEGAVIFINLYFDLVEIKRRELEKELNKKSHSSVEINALYQNTLAELKIQRRTFFNEMVRGKNKEAVIKWNAYVRSKLGIDNIKYLGFDAQ